MTSPTGTCSNVRIRDAVDEHATPRRAWWRRWQIRFALPVLALGAAATVAIVLARSRATPEAPVAVTPPAPAPLPRSGSPSDELATDTVALYLDGTEVDVPLDELDDSALSALDRDVLGLDDVSEETLRAEGDVMLAPDTARWIDTIDELDDGALDRARDWLDRQTARLHRKGGKS